MKRKRLHRMLWMQILLVFLLSCSGNGNRSESSATMQPEQQMNKEIQRFIEQWKSDSLGCQKLRNKEKAEAIIDSLKLDSTNQVEFLEVFGKPNADKEREGDLILSYYFDALCADGMLVDSADYCIAEFTFIGNRLKKRNYICH